MRNFEIFRTLAILNTTNPQIRGETDHVTQCVFCHMKTRGGVGLTEATSSVPKLPSKDRKAIDAETTYVSERTTKRRKK